MSWDSVQKILVLSLGAAAVLLGLSVLVAAFNLGVTIVSSIMLLIIQVLLTLAAVVLILAIVALVTSCIYSALVRQIESLVRQNEKILEKLSKRTPTFVTATALAASFVMLIADKAFSDQKIPTICVGIVLTILFWIANELLLDESRPKSVLGGVIWGTAFLFLPVAVLLQNNGDIYKVMHKLSNVGLSTILILGLAFLVACSAPLALKRNV